MDAALTAYPVRRVLDAEGKPVGAPDDLLDGERTGFSPRPSSSMPWASPGRPS